MSGLTFEPGEVAILKNGDGGRIFIAHEQVEEGVIERHPNPDQQRYVTLPTRLTQLVKLPSPEKAHELIGRLKQIAAERDTAIANAKRLASAKFGAVILDYGTDGEDHFKESGR